MNYEPKVSIITVCRNSVETIEQTIQSVLNQTYTNIEYIVIDGASDDGTCDIIENYKAKLGYYCSEPDNGIYHAMNKGLQHTTGDIIGILNSDDWYTENAVENVVKTFLQYDCEMVHGKLAMVYEENRIRVVEERNLEDLYIGMVVSHPTVFLKKSIYQQYGLFDEQYRSAADYELMLRLYTKGVSIRFVPEILTFFRRGGFSEKATLLNAQETLGVSEKYIKAMKGQDKEELLQRALDTYKEKEYRFRIGHTISTLSEHEKEEVVRKITSQRPVIVFGTGMYGYLCYELLDKLSVELLAWADNDSRKQGVRILDILVYPPDRIFKGEYKIIISSPKYESEMISQLKKMGFSDTDYMTYTDMEKVIIGYESK